MGSGAYFYCLGGGGGLSKCYGSYHRKVVEMYNVLESLIGKTPLMFTKLSQE